MAQSRRHGAANAGGVAAQAGPDYQNRVGAWLAVHILEGPSAVLNWLPSTAEWVGAESDEPMDDLLLGGKQQSTEAGRVTWMIPIQAKRRLTIDESDGSMLASALDQCVRQHIKDADATHFRELLVVSGIRSSTQVRVDLPKLLNRLRAPRTYGPILRVAMNQPADERTLDVLLRHIRRSWHQATDKKPDEEDIKSLLARLRFDVIDVDDGGRHEREAKCILKDKILRDPSQADLAWDRLIRKFAALSKQRATADRHILRDHLADAGIVLKHSDEEALDSRAPYRFWSSANPSPSGASRVPGLNWDLIGRDAQMKDIMMWLRQGVPDRRLITLAGIGGIGKTELLKSAACQVEDLHQRVIYIALRRDAPSGVEELAREVMRWIGPSESTPPVSSLVAELAGDPTVLFLDGCEARLSDVQELLAELFDTGVPLRVLATSQEPLLLPEETAWQIPPLAPADAAQLFVQRLRKGFSTQLLNSSEIPAVEKLCAYVGFVPLFVTIVAAQVSSTRLPSKVLTDIEAHAQSVLDVQLHAMPMRHRSAEQVLSYAYSRLSQTAQRALAACAVFPGSFDDRELAATMGFRVDPISAPPPEAIGAREELFHYSLAVTGAEAAIDEPAAVGARFRLLDPIRHFAARRLDGSEGPPWGPRNSPSKAWMEADWDLATYYDELFDITGYRAHPPFPGAAARLFNDAREMIWALQYDHEHASDDTIVDWDDFRFPIHYIVDLERAPWEAIEAYGAERPNWSVVDVARLHMMLNDNGQPTYTRQHGPMVDPFDWPDHEYPLITVARHEVQNGHLLVAAAYLVALSAEQSESPYQSVDDFDMENLVESLDRARQELGAVFRIRSRRKPDKLVIRWRSLTSEDVATRAGVSNRLEKDCLNLIWNQAQVETSSKPRKRKSSQLDISLLKFNLVLWFMAGSSASMPPFQELRKVLRSLARTSYGTREAVVWLLCFACVVAARKELATKKDARDAALALGAVRQALASAPQVSDMPLDSALGATTYGELVNKALTTLESDRSDVLGDSVQEGSLLGLTEVMRRIAPSRGIATATDRQ